MNMLPHNLTIRAVKRGFSCQPLKKSNPQSVLISGRAHLSTKALWGHVHCRTYPSVFHQLSSLWTRSLDESGNTKITQQDLTFCSHQHIRRFHVQMDKVTVMNVFKRSNNLFKILHDGIERKPISEAMTLLQGTMWCKTHNKIGNYTISVELTYRYIVECKYCHNMRMLQTCHNTRFFKEVR